MERCHVCGDWVETDGESSDDVYCSPYCREYQENMDNETADDPPQATDRQE